MATSVTSCLLCLGAYAQARYMVVCLSVCLSVSPTTFSIIDPPLVTRIYCAGLQLLSKCHYNLLLTVYIAGIFRGYKVLQNTIRNFVDSGIVF